MSDQEINHCPFMNTLMRDVSTVSLMAQEPFLEVCTFWRAPARHTRQCRAIWRTFTVAANQNQLIPPSHSPPTGFLPILVRASVAFLENGNSSTCVIP